jgi:hypothetical protein
MFVVFVAVIHGRVSETGAAPISVTIKSTNFVTASPSPGPDVRLQLSVGGNAVPPVALWLPGISPDSGDRLLNYQIGDPPSYAVTIREEDAAELGLDWTAFEQSMLGFDKNVYLRYGVPETNTFSQAFASVRSSIFNTGVFPRPVDLAFATFHMEEIRVQIDYYFWHPVLSGLRSAKVSFEIVGSGVVIPEPSAVCLVMLASSLMVLPRRRAWLIS